MAYEFENNHPHDENSTSPTPTPTPQNSGYSRYYGESSYGSQNYQAPSPLGEQKPPRQKKNSKAGKAVAYVAGLLAVGVISGAAGGAFTYSLMKRDSVIAPSSQAPQSSATAQSSTNVDIPSQAEVPAASTPSTSSIPSGGVADVVEIASGSVVEITITASISNPFYGGQQMVSASGSGVILTADGYIATNNHVIEGANDITVRTKDGTEYVGTLVGTDEQTDLAVVKIDASGLSTIDFANSDELKVGEVAIAIGNPQGTLGGTVTSGIVSALNRELTIDSVTLSNLIQTSAPVNPGNSGGGLFDANGNLIGIVNAKSTTTSSGTVTEGLGFAIPSNVVRSVTDSIIAHGYVTGRPELGISVYQIADTQTAFYFRVNEYGVYIVDVTKENGLAYLDRIVSINGKEVTSREDVVNTVAEMTVGETLAFVVIRDGEEITVQVPVTEKVPAYIQQQRAAGRDV
jgi:serine protease Do